MRLLTCFLNACLYSFDDAHLKGSAQQFPSSPLALPFKSHLKTDSSYSSSRRSKGWLALLLSATAAALTSLNLSRLFQSKGSAGPDQTALRWDQERFAEARAATQTSNAPARLCAPCAGGCGGDTPLFETHLRIRAVRKSALKQNDLRKRCVAISFSLKRRLLNFFERQTVEKCVGNLASVRTTTQWNGTCLLHRL